MRRGRLCWPGGQVICGQAPPRLIAPSARARRSTPSSDCVARVSMRPPAGVVLATIDGAVLVQIGVAAIFSSSLPVINGPAPDEIDTRMSRQPNGGSVANDR